MKIEEIRDLSDGELLDLYADVVRICHYDPCETPKWAKDLWAEGISYHEIGRIILGRMK